MKNHAGNVRQFRHLARTWYWQANSHHQNYTDEILIGYYSPDGGTSGEFAIRWIPLRTPSTPQLQVFSDSWHALAIGFQDVLARLAELDSQDVAPIEMCRILVECGIEDATEETSS